MRHTLLFLMEGGVVLAVLIALATGLLAWKLKSGPIDLAFAKTTVEAAFSDADEGRTMSFGHASLTWPDLAGPLMLSVQNIEVYGPDGALQFSAEDADIGLRGTALLIGRISPRSLILRRISLSVVRSASGWAVSVASNGRGKPAKAVKKDEKSLLQTFLSPEDQKKGRVRTPFGRLREVTIENARVMIDDQINRDSWSIPRIDLSLKPGQHGMEAALSADLPIEDGKISGISANAVLLRDTGEIDIQAGISNVDLPEFSKKIPGLGVFSDQHIILNAALKARLASDFSPLSLQANMQAPAGSVTIPEWSEAPVPFSNMKIAAAYESADKQLSIEEISATIDGVKVSLSGKLQGEGGTATGPLRLDIPEIEQGAIDRLWPIALRGDNAEKWAAHRITAGTFTNAFAEANIAVTPSADGAAWSLQAANMQAGFEFDGLAVDYRAPMIPVTKAKGRGVFDYAQQKLNIFVDEGKAGDLNISEGALEFVNILESGKGLADINLNLDGPLAGAFAYAEKEPIHLNHPFNVRDINGAVALNVNVNFPTTEHLPVEDVKVLITGTMNDITLPGVVGKLDLTGGPFKVDCKDGEFKVSGSGKLGGRLARADFQAYLSSKGKPHVMKIQASMVTDDDVRAGAGIDLSEYIKGPAPVDVTYTEMAGGKSTAEVSADIDATQVFIKDLGYEKKVGQPGTVKLSALLEKGKLTQIKNLSATSQDLAIENASLTFRATQSGPEVENASFPSLTAGETKGKLEISHPASKPMSVTFTGPFFNLQPAMESGAQQDEDKPAMMVSLSADKMRTSPEETIDRARLTANIDAEGGFNRLELDALAGNAPVALRYAPGQDGSRGFTLTAADAGAALKAFGVYDKIKGGTLNITGKAAGGDDRNQSGTAEIQNFKVVNAPTLARLLGALSLPGILSLLDREGVSFTRLQADFNWQYKTEGSLLTLKDGRTAGNSLGLTFDGTLDRSKNALNISGTLVPMSGINGMIGKIPLLGDIITGGTGSLFAATYTIKGNADQPDVFVNPLSVLTPGILRRILFE